MDGQSVNPTTLSFHLSETLRRWIKGILSSGQLTLSSFLPIIFIISAYGEHKATTVQTLDTFKADLSGVKHFPVLLVGVIFLPPGTRMFDIEPVLVKLFRSQSQSVLKLTCLFSKVIFHFSFIMRQRILLSSFLPLPFSCPPPPLSPPLH